MSQEKSSLPTREPQLHLGEPAEVGGENRLPSARDFRLGQFRDPDNDSVDKFQAALQLFLAQVQLATSEGSQLRHHRVEVALKQTGDN